METTCRTIFEKRQSNGLFSIPAQTPLRIDGSKKVPVELHRMALSAARFQTQADFIDFLFRASQNCFQEAHRAAEISLSSPTDAAYHRWLETRKAYARRLCALLGIANEEICPEPKNQVCQQIWNAALEAAPKRQTGHGVWAAWEAAQTFFNDCPKAFHKELWDRTGTVRVAVVWDALSFEQVQALSAAGFEVPYAIICRFLNLSAV